MKKRDPNDFLIKWAPQIHQLTTTGDLIHKAKSKQLIPKVTSHHNQGGSQNIYNQATNLKKDASNASKKDSHGSTIQLSSFYDDINLISILKTSQIYHHQKDKDNTKIEALNMVHQTTKNQVFESRRSSRNQSKVDINSPMPNKDKVDKMLTEVSQNKHGVQIVPTIENSIQ